MQAGDSPPSLADKFGGIGLKGQAQTNSEIKVSGLQPINLRLLDKDQYTQPPFKPRHYQVELFKRALKENVIIYLGTGLGKTFITVMVLNSPQIDEQIKKGRKVIFLAPTQDLVKQQAEYICGKVPYKVKVYCGRTCHTGLHINYWKEADWNSELAKIDVLFMVPAIFANAVGLNFLSWAKISLVIYDEAHHAATSKKEKSGKSSGHAYSQSLAHYNQLIARSGSVKPRIIGLTASLINNMPTNADSIRIGVCDLERKMDAKCVTDLNVNDSKPQVVIYSYNKPGLNKENDILSRLFYDYAERLEVALASGKAKKLSDLGPKTDKEREILAYLNRLRLASSGFSIKPNSFCKVLKQLAAIRANSGIWTLANICYNLIIAMEKHSKSPVLSPEIKPIYLEFGAILNKIVKAIDELVGFDYKNILFEYSQPKLMCLLDILRNEYSRVRCKASDKETFSCIVFVKSRVEVVAICSWLRMVSEHIPGYNFIKANYAIGLSATMASKWACITRRRSTEQSAMLENFRRGFLNVIVTTSVLEEGIDLPVCSTVIRYDKADTFRAYVQSRGRARQSAATFVALCESEKKAVTELELTKYNDFENRVKEILTSDAQPHTQRSAGIGQVQDQDEDFFRDDEKGIFIGPSISRVVLHMYCQRLANKCPYSDGLQYVREKPTPNTFLTSLYFPPGCPVTDCVRGFERNSVLTADSSAIVAAFRALYQAGELDEHGVPIKATEEHVDGVLAKYNMAPDLSPLGRELQGEVQQVNEYSELHSFPWKLCDLNTNLSRGFSARKYKLFRVNFIAIADDLVRLDTRHYFEQSTYGLIVDASRDCLSWPDKLLSHYGEFRVEYKLVADNLPLDEHRFHKAYFNYTFSVILNFWNLRGIRKDDFMSRCLFYLVPLDSCNDVDWIKLQGAFFPTQTSLKRGDIVKIHPIYSSSSDASKKFVVKDVHHDMNAHSRIPGSRGETFLERIQYHYGDFRGDVHQPVVEVCPIAREFARSSKGKKVRSDQTTSNIFYLWQFLEPIKCDAPTAYQAYNFPEIIYKIYLTTLACDLDQQFQRLTATFRQNIILAEPVGEDLDNDVARSEDGDESGDENENDSPTHGEDSGLLDGACFYSEDEEPGSSGDSDNSSSDDSSDCDSDDSEGLSSKKKYDEILSRQRLNLNDRDKSGLEKWDLSEYNMPDMKVLPTQHVDFYHAPKYIDTNPRASSLQNLITDTIQHQMEIEKILQQFQKDILGRGTYLGDDDEYGRPGSVVDLDLKPPVKFDRVTKPLKEVPREHVFLEALTQKKAGDRFNLEALENVGDSYLKYSVSVLLFKNLEHNEGLMTLARSRLVGNKHFAHLAMKNKLGFYAIAKRFDSEVLESALGAMQPPCSNSLRVKDLADLFESLIGACLVYRGEYEAILAMKWLGLAHLFYEDTFAEFHENAVTFSRHATSLSNQDNPETLSFLRQCKKRVKRFQAIIKYEFHDPSYLVQAFTHASAPIRCTESYERLEFLGDAILDFLITMTLYDAGFTTDPGQITDSRSALVNNCTFAKLSIKYKFDIFIQHSCQELFDELNRLNEFAKLDPNLEFLDMVDFDKVVKILADVLESVAGAIYLDSGCSLDTVYQIFYPMLKELIDREIKEPTRNPVRELYEIFPGKDRVTFEFFKVEAGKDESYITAAKCSIVGFADFYGEGSSKRQAKKRAITQALANLPTPEVKAKLDEEYRKSMPDRRSNRNAHAANRRGGRGRGPARGRGRGRGFYARR